MKNFKLFALVLCLVMLVSSAAMADMTPGTYTGVATGMFDGLTVEVTVSATAIEDIKVTSHNETAPGWPALEKLPAAIVAAQSIAASRCSTTARRTQTHSRSDAVSTSSRLG